MKYMFLLYSAEDAGPQPGAAEQAEEMQAWFAFTEARPPLGC